MTTEEPLSDPVWAWSASGRDGGVRATRIKFKPERWKFLPVPWAHDNAVDLIDKQRGKKYDFGGLLGSQLFNLRMHRPNHWFCSEICAYALGLARPHSLSPGDLFDRVSDMNRAFQLGQQEVGEPPEETQA